MIATSSHSSNAPADLTDSSATEPEKRKVRSTLVSRNVTVSGQRTSIRLEPEMWDGLREICRRERTNFHNICTSIALQKQDLTSLTAAIRVFVMRYFRMASTEEGHGKAGHGYGLTVAIGAQPSQNFGAKPPTPLNIVKRGFA